MKKKMFLRIGRKGVNLDKYAGSWVAFLDNKPVAWDKTLKDLMEKVEEKHFSKEPSVMLVPHKGEGPYLLTIIL
ncbi:hypothetical protein A3J90_04765 [candidate division WOR-1 bacterium RIFOXYC2_FULL_37_10]|uniref:DUF5678 domain-containing protein n=1 Tax=candidate division WOR-1 bacterium RIFOXYB2_FULL_37_13 TaxID=1802579 RepID=A0A1F4SVH5_UNCSA|nr:MAG: hypothetical protein A2246_06385 [candidate division WOR-1 bacterium RIFOXYA2_FULL_37_7]OGC24438.1 MAG: hypothetical protein A2310_08535 [candidate division WOR-1 bacterium RIFOXYB2_FULL_37_13]OGC35536.1 MAG: hypothetical protein A3J90_04765 [candidate division WOR-1 bacterium RIFOXYC2_FULL_37_10]